MKDNIETNGIINKLKGMNDRLYEDLQVERRIVMNYNVYGTKWEKALRKYDELAIRYDQMRKVFEELGIKVATT